MIYASQRDAFTFLAGVADNSYDCVVTDYPYPTLERHRSHGTTVRLQEAWFDVLSIQKLVEVTAELYRVLKPNSYAFIFVDADTEMLLSWAMGVPQALMNGLPRSPKCRENPRP